MENTIFTKPVGVDLVILSIHGMWRVENVMLSGEGKHETPIRSRTEYLHLT